MSLVKGTFKVVTYSNDYIIYNCHLSITSLLINCPNNCPHTHTLPQLQGLGPVVSNIAHLERSYVAMARALDATRHDMDLRGILPVDEGEGQSTLCNHVNRRTPWGHDI